MLAYDLLNKNRQTSPISGCQILDDRLATIPCLGRLQTLIWTDSLEIIHRIQGRVGEGGRGKKTIPGAHATRARSVLAPWARDPSRILLLKRPPLATPRPHPKHSSHSGRSEMRRFISEDHNSILCSRILLALRCSHVIKLPYALIFKHFILYYYKVHTGPR